MLGGSTPRSTHGRMQLEVFWRSHMFWSPMDYSTDFERKGASAAPARRFAPRIGGWDDRAMGVSGGVMAVLAALVAVLVGAAAGVAGGTAVVEPTAEWI